MVTRITSGVFIICGNKVLLMKRGLHKELAPGLWAGVGGHLDITDIKNPRAIDLADTCLREIYEETGLTKADIHILKLKYIVIRKVGDEIRMHHHHFAEIKTQIPPPICEEGEFFWIEKEEMLGLPMSTSLKESLKHWASNPVSDTIFTVVVNAADTSATVVEV